MTRTIPLLYDSVSPNTGDIAMGIAGSQVFARMGRAAAPVSPFDADSAATTIVGGGELIRVTGDDFYDRFRLPGAHILNAAGVWTNANDLNYLKAYRWVSTRSTREAEVVAGSVPDVQVVPCTTTLLESEHFPIPGALEGEPLVGIHLAPHAMRFIDDIVGVINAIPHRKVLIPFTHYIDDKSFMEALPFDRSQVITLDALAPLEIHAVLRQMRYVVVTSLHASIFSYSQNVPFASVAQRKVGYYFADRGLTDHVVSTKGELVAHLHRLEEEPPDYTATVEADKAAVTRAYAAYAEILDESERDSAALWHPTAPTADATSRTQALLLSQAKSVLHDRDLTISVLESRRAHVDASLEALRLKRRNRAASFVGRHSRGLKRRATLILKGLTRSR